MAHPPERVGDSTDDIDSEEESPSSAAARQFLNRPDILAALQGRAHQEMLDALPQVIKGRIKALKNLQLETINIEAKFFEEVHLLEDKYHKLYSPLYAKRGEIISGAYEPTEKECQFESDAEEKSDLSSDLKTKVKIVDLDSGDTKRNKKNALSETTKGIPDFWLTIFKNVQMLAEMVQEHDEPILKHLADIQVEFLKENPMGFILEFHFTPNEYFSNAVLTKTYEMKCVPDEVDPFTFEGPEIFKCSGCKLDWKKGKNVTEKNIKKKQKHKSRGSVRTVTKTVKVDSFFNFFSPPVVPEDPEAEMDDDTQNLLTADFEIGHYIRERIIPRAVLYFTGEALDEEEDYEEEEEDGAEEGEEEEDEDEDSAIPPAHAIQGPDPADCKQQ